MDYFFDSSGLAKRYIVEPGTGWVNAIVQPAGGNRIHIAQITGVEVMSAIWRRLAGGGISRAHAGAAAMQLRREFASFYRITDVTAILIERAMTLAEQHLVRAYDAVQPAAALQVRSAALAMALSVAFVSADDELSSTAAAEGLVVENPNAHP